MYVCEHVGSCRYTKSCFHFCIGPWGVSTWVVCPIEQPLVFRSKFTYNCRQILNIIHWDFTKINTGTRDTHSITVITKTRHSSMSSLDWTSIWPVSFCAGDSRFAQCVLMSVRWWLHASERAGCDHQLCEHGEIQNLQAKHDKCSWVILFINYRFSMWFLVNKIRVCFIYFVQNVWYL